MSWVDMLRREGTCRDVTIHCTDEESATSHGHTRQELDESSMGEIVRCVAGVFQLRMLIH